MTVPPTAPNTMAAILAAQGTPQATSASTRKFWVAIENQTIAKTEAELQALVDAGQNPPTMLQGENAWKTPKDYGVLKTVAAEVVPSTPAAPETPAAPAAPAAPPAPVAATPPATPPTSAPANLPATPPSAAATGALARLANFNQKYQLAAATSTSIMAAFEETDGGGMSHSLPFTHLKNGNWADVKQVDAAARAHLPSGTRPYSCVYLGHRIGITGWKGEPGRGSTGAPLWRFVLPTPAIGAGMLADAATADGKTFDVDVTSLVHRAIKVARDFQYTRRERRAIYDTVGRPNIELQTLVWVPNLPFGLLVVNAFKPCERSLKSLSAADENGQNFLPFTIAVEKDTEVNKAAQKRKDAGEVVDPKTLQWDYAYVTATLDSTPTGMALRQAYMDFQQSKPDDLLKVLTDFHTGADFAGESLTAIGDLLTRLEALSEKK